MGCEWEQLAREIAWNAFRRKLKERVLKKLAKRAVIGATAAAIDGPLPIGDFVGLVITVWSVAETGISLWDAYHSWKFIQKDVLERTQRLLAKAFEKYGDDLLNDEACCECLLEYLRRLARARNGNSARFKRIVISETKRLINCFKTCKRR